MWLSSCRCEPATIDGVSANSADRPRHFSCPARLAAVPIRGCFQPRRRGLVSGPINRRTSEPACDPSGNTEAGSVFGCCVGQAVDERVAGCRLERAWRLGDAERAHGAGVAVSASRATAVAVRSTRQMVLGTRGALAAGPLRLAGRWALCRSARARRRARGRCGSGVHGCLLAFGGAVVEQPRGRRQPAANRPPTGRQRRE